MKDKAGRKLPKRWACTSNEPLGYIGHQQFCSDSGTRSRQGWIGQNPVVTSWSVVFISHYLQGVNQRDTGFHRQYDSIIWPNLGPNLDTPVLNRKILRWCSHAPPMKTIENLHCKVRLVWTNGASCKAAWYHIFPSEIGVATGRCFHTHLLLSIWDQLRI